MSKFKRRPLAAAVLALFSSAAAAQSAPEATLPEVRVRGANDGFRTDSTTSGTRTDTPLRDIPQTINSVPQELIRSQGASSLSDALRNVPGISYAAPEGGTQANTVYYLRGVPAGGDLFLDSIRDLGEYNRDLFNIEQVDVLKGPSSLMYGRGSTGGVVNQLSKTPMLLPKKELSLTLGSEDKKRLTGDLNLKTGENSAFRVNLLAEKSGNYRYPQDVERIGFAPSLRLGIGGGTDLTLSYFYLKTRDVTDYGQPSLVVGGTFLGFAPWDPKRYYGFDRHDYTEHETHLATAKLEHRINDQLSLRNTLRFGSYRRKMEATIAVLNAKDANGAAITPTTPLNLLLVDRDHNKARDNDDHVVINQTELTWKLGTGAVRHTVLGGLELAAERLDRNTYTFGGNFQNSLTPLLAPDPSTTLNYTKTPLDRFRSDADTVALYAQDQVEFSEQWKALFGLRWERFDAHARQNSIATGAVVVGMDGNPVDFSRVDRMLSSRAGLIWQPTQAQSYYLSYGNSFNPSGELGVYGGTATNLSAQNDDLKPEQNRNYEAGAQWDFRSGLQLRSALFRNDKTNARMADPVSGLQVLAGKRRVEGAEFGLTGHLAPNWDISAAMAIMTGRILNGPANVVGQRPLGVPSNSGSLWSVYRLGGGWEAGGGLTWSSEKYLDDQNRGQLPGYTRVDATVAYVARNYELRLNLNNVFDEEYYYGGYNNNPNRVLPGQPREFQVTLRYNFD